MDTQTEHARRLRAFYDQVVARAADACQDWAHPVPRQDTGAGQVAFAPHGNADPDQLDAWPAGVHAAGAGWVSPGFVLDAEMVEEAFTEILRVGSEVPTDATARARMHRAEQEGEVAQLTSRDVSQVVQVAVFGGVVYP